MSRGLGISALSCHANPLHPRADLARASHESYRARVGLAARLDIPTVVLFSGCPGAPDSTEYPNWVTCASPTEFREILEWQWCEKVLPYWREEAAFAQQHGVRLAFEMHPGMVVYNPTTLLRLREACGEAIGAQERERGHEHATVSDRHEIADSCRRLRQQQGDGVRAIGRGLPIADRPARDLRSYRSTPGRAFGRRPSLWFPPPRLGRRGIWVGHPTGLGPRRRTHIDLLTETESCWASTLSIRLCHSM